MPKVGDKVLIYPDTYESDWENHNQTGTILWALFDDSFENGLLFQAYDYQDDCYYEMKEQPTHWMELPKPPQD